MRILIITHYTIDVNLAELYRMIAMAETGIELTVVIVEHDRGIPLPPETPFKVEPARLRNPADYLEGFVESDLQRIISAAKPDIIQCFSEAFSPYVLQVVWLAARYASRAKVLFYAYENMPISSGLRTKLKVKPAWIKLAGGEAASQGAVDTLRRAGFPPDKPIKIIPFGIGTRTFFPMDRATIKKELGLDERPYIGYAGRLIPEKGIKTLLAAMAELPSQTHCLIIGKGPLAADVQLWGSLPVLQGRVHHIPEVDPTKLGKYMNAMDVLTLPSVRAEHWMEQYGRVLPEAMCCGTPLIGSDSGAIPEVIGDAGVIVPEYDYKALAREARKLIEDRDYWREVSQRGLARAPKFTDRAMSASLVEFFQEMLSR